MIYMSTQNNLQEVLRDVGTVTVDQLLRFFRNAMDAKSLPRYIRTLVDYHIFDHDKTNNWLTFHGTPELTQHIIRRRVMAFWIIADFGYDNVREISALKYPQDLFFITEQNQMYEITVCLSEKDAELATQFRKMTSIEGFDDQVNHLALVNSHEVGRAALKHGYDSYCILDPNQDMAVDYFTGEEDLNE